MLYNREKKTKSNLTFPYVWLGVPAAYFLFAGNVLGAYFLLAGSVPAVTAYSLFADKVPAYNLFHTKYTVSFLFAFSHI